MARTAALLISCALTVACSTDDGASATQEPTTTAAPTTTEAEGYPTFDDVDTNTNPYFISLEDKDLDNSAEALVWDTGVTVCENLDTGATIQDELDRLADLEWTAAPSIVASAALYICDDHEQAARDYVDANS